MSDEIHERFIEIANELSPALSEAIARSEPVRLVPNRDCSFPERLCRAISGQQLSVKAARSIWYRVLENSRGTDLVEHLSTVEPAVLRACGLSAAKAKAMRAVALACLEGQLDEKELNALDSGDRSKRLSAIWGVGQWTADMMSIFYFGDGDIWPDGDATARKTLERLTSSRRKTIRTASRFAPYRSYLALYMWQQADTIPT